MIENETYVVLKYRFDVRGTGSLAGQGSTTAIVPYDSDPASFTSNLVVRDADGRVFHVLEKATVEVASGEITPTLLKTNCIRF